MQKWSQQLHVYAETGLFLVLFRSCFLEILLILRGRMVGWREGGRMPAEGEWLSVCWQMAIGLMTDSHSYSSPTAIGHVSDGYRTTDRLFFDYSPPVVWCWMFPFRLPEFAVFEYCVLCIWLCFSLIRLILTLRIPHFRPNPLLDGNTGFSQVEYAIWHFVMWGIF